MDEHHVWREWWAGVADLFPGWDWDDAEARDRDGVVAGIGFAGATPDESLYVLVGRLPGAPADEYVVVLVSGSATRVARTRGRAAARAIVCAVVGGSPWVESPVRFAEELGLDPYIPADRPAEGAPR